MRKNRKMHKRELGSISKRILVALLLVMINDSSESACAAQPNDSVSVRPAANEALR